MGWFLRRPLALFAAIVVVGGVVIAVGLKVSGGASGASGYSATPLSSAQFADLNEHACLSLRKQLGDVTDKNPRSRKYAARSVRAVASAVAGLNMELDGRVPPSSEVASFRRFLGRLQMAERAMNQLVRLTESGQWHRATLLVRSSSWPAAIGKHLEQSAKARDTRCGRARPTDAILTAMAIRVSRGTSVVSSYFARRPLSPAQFVHRIEHICVAARAQLEQIVAEKPASLEDAANKIDNLTSSLDNSLTELHALTPPRSIAVPFRHVLGYLQAGDRAMHNLAELGDTGQWRLAIRLVRSRQWHNMVYRFGPPPATPGAIQCG
jgi:hypothetical protein